MDNDYTSFTLNENQINQFVWILKTTVRGAHQNWRSYLNVARSGLPVVIQDGRNSDIEPVCIVPWHYILLLERLNLVPLKSPRRPLSEADVKRLQEAYKVLYNTLEDENEI